MAAATPTNVKPAGPDNWKKVFDSALNSSWDKDDRAHAPIYRRQSATHGTASQTDDNVEVAAKALAALWGTKRR